MKTLGFGLKSLMRDPQWAQKHNINPNNQTAGSVVGDNKTGGAAQAEKSIFDRAKTGDIHNANNIFAQSQNRVNGINADSSIFAQSKIGGANNNIFAQNKVNGLNAENNIFAQSKVGASNQNNNIFAMMNKFDEDHKTLMGAQGVQPMQQQDAMNPFGTDEIQKRIGKRLNLMM